MFNKESGHHGEVYKLRVIYFDPHRPPSPVREGSKEDFSPRALVSENGHSNAPEFQFVSNQWAFTWFFTKYLHFSSRLTVVSNNHAL